jgi:hypothetical protein
LSIECSQAKISGSHQICRISIRQKSILEPQRPPPCPGGRRQGQREVVKISFAFLAPFAVKIWVIVLSHKIAQTEDPKPNCFPTLIWGEPILLQPFGKLPQLDRADQFETRSTSHHFVQRFPTDQVQTGGVTLLLHTTVQFLQQLSQSETELHPPHLA